MTDPRPLPPPPATPAAAPPRRSRAASIALWSILGALIAGSALLMATRRPPPPEPKAGEKPVPVRLLTLQPRAIEDAVTLAGRLEPSEDVTLSAQKPGQIVEIAVDKGDAVRRGQVLARLDNRTWEAQRRQAEVERDEASRELQRYRELDRAGAVSTSDYERVANRLERAEATLSWSAANVDQCRIVSPVDGRIEDRYRDAGEHAMEGGEILRVVVTDPMKLVVDVPERDVARLRPGDALAFAVPAAAGAAVTGRVSFVASAADRASNTYRVEALVDAPPAALKAGMIASARIVRGLWPDAILVPIAAVVPKKGEHVAFVEKDGRAVRRSLRLAALAGDEAVVASGLEAGERLVVEGQRTLVDGTLLDVGDAAERAAP
jgi:RND family efflux transporter MFP subunit